MKSRWELRKTVNLGLLGIAKKAGFLLAGEETVTDAIKSGGVKLVIIASDTGDSSKRKAKDAAGRSGVICLEVPCTKFELGGAVGRGETGIVCLTDAGIAASFAEKLVPLGSEYEAAHSALKQRADKMIRRRKETAARKTKSNIGKRRSNQ